jgi:hypothetical protein
MTNKFPNCPHISQIIPIESEYRNSVDFLSLKQTMVIDVREVDELRYLLNKDQNSNSLQINGQKLFGVSKITPSPLAQSTVQIFSSENQEMVKNICESLYT